MAQNKKSFIAYVDWKATFETLPDEKAGQLIKHLFAYVNDDNPKTDDVLINAAFANIKQQLKRDLRKWESTSEKRADIGRVGGLKSGEVRQEKAKQNEANEAIASETKQTEANPTKPKQNEHDNDNVNDNDNAFNNYKKLLKKVLTENQIVLPDEFEPLILEWLKYKSEKGQSYKETGLKTLIKTFLRDSEGDKDIGRAMLDYSMSKNYSGLFKEKSNGTNQSDHQRSVKRINSKWDM